MVGKVVSLVDRRASKEVVETLLQLLAEARRGEIPGLAYVAMHYGDYSADAVGTAKTSRIYTLGVLRRLEHRLLDD